MGNPLQALYKDQIGYTINLTVQENGAPIDLTSATTTLYMYSVGTNTEVWNHACTNISPTNGTCYYTTVSGDLATVGMYYTKIKVVTTGATRWFSGPQFEIIQAQENAVTVDDFLQYVNIASENAMSEGTIKRYLEDAEVQVTLDLTTLATTSTVNFIKLKRVLIMKQAAVTYFSNLDEQAIDPNRRLEKAKFWREEYNRTLEAVHAVTSTDGETGMIRRVKNSCYTDTNSYLYDEDEV